MLMITTVRARRNAGIAAAAFVLIAAAGCAAPGAASSAKTPPSGQDPAQACTLGRALVAQALSASSLASSQPAGIAGQLRGLANAAQDDAVQEQLTYAADAAAALVAALQAGDNTAANGARQVLSGFGRTCPVANGLFAGGTSGWAGAAAATQLTTTQLTTTGTGPAGGNALQVSSAAAGSCGFTDTPRVVATTLPGTYTLRLWVRAPAGGPSVTAQLSELSGSSVVSQSTATVTATNGWQRMHVALRPKGFGHSSLAIAVSANSPAAGICFDAADISLTRG